MILRIFKKIKINGIFLLMKCVRLIFRDIYSYEKHVQESFFCFVNLKDGNRILCIGT
jgi:hypothetical protein